ncbi:3-methyladenine DNA glycosylase [Janthinobacterium sp. HH01]|nr:3-methyladenine DNA glycosylase [Janthinobacterium sp. HH01]
MQKQHYKPVRSLMLGMLTLIIAASARGGHEFLPIFCRRQHILSLNSCKCGDSIIICHAFRERDGHIGIYNSRMDKLIAGIDFNAPSDQVARQLIGVTLLVDGVGGRIVEAEAYDRTEPAAHSYNGPTPRNFSMFGPPGRSYVYRSHGLHWCLNFVCREEGHGAGVLIRALEPLAGLEAMRARRGLDDGRLLCAGPGRLCQALGVTRAHNNLALAAPPFTLLAREAAAVEVLAGPRIGISKAVELPWRFGLAGSRFLSKPMREA